MPLSKLMKADLARLLQEEEMDLFLLTLHYRNDGDLSFFPHADRKKIKKILDLLIHDTERHSELLQSILDSDGE